MVFRRSLVAGLVIVWSAIGASAEVRLQKRKDGRAVLSNVPVSGSLGGSRGSDLRWLAKQRFRVSPWDAIIDRYADRWNVDPLLVKAVIQVESNYDPACVSRKGARGLMQLMPGTARRFGVRNVHDPEENIRGGVQYLSVLMGMFPNDLSRVLAAYNAGENAVLRHGGIPPYQETQTYVQRALTVYRGVPQAGGIMRISSRSGGRGLAGGFKSQSAGTKIAAGTGSGYISSTALNVR